MSRLAFGLIAVLAALLLGGNASAQTGSAVAPEGEVEKSADAKAGKRAGGKDKAKLNISGTYGQWALLCGEPKEKELRPRCSLVQALVEKSSNQLVFRVVVTYGPKGKLILKIDGPTGIALQRGLEFALGEAKLYRMPFHTCVPKGCSALLVIEDDLKQDLLNAEKGTLTVYALDGRPLRALAELKGFADGLAALDKAQPEPEAAR